MKISVCMATYNGENYIYTQLKSILSQIDANDEVIISDDSSTDETVDIIESFNDPRVKVLKNNTFYNPIYNFENALKKASGDIIVLSDQDDIWLNNKIGIIRNKFQNNTTDIYTVVLDGYVINGDGDIIHDSIFDLNKAGRGILKNILKNTYMGCCMAFTTELLEISLNFPKNIPMHDSWLGLLSEMYGKVEFVHRKTIKYREHQSNVSLKKNCIFKKINWRMNLIYNLLKRYLRVRRSVK